MVYAKSNSALWGLIYFQWIINTDHIDIVGIHIPMGSVG